MSCLPPNPSHPEDREQSLTDHRHTTAQSTHLTHYLSTHTVHVATQATAQCPAHTHTENKGPWSILKHIATHQTHTPRCCTAGRTPCTLHTALMRVHSEHTEDAEVVTTQHTHYRYKRPRHCHSAGPSSAHCTPKGMTDSVSVSPARLASALSLPLDLMVPVPGLPIPRACPSSTGFLVS